MMKKRTALKPLVRHTRSQNARSVFVVEATAAVVALIRILLSNRSRLGEKRHLRSGSLARGLAGGLALGCRVQNDSGYAFRLGEHGDVARLELGGRGFHALGKETFLVRRDRLVESRNDVPRRLRLPRDRRDLRAERRSVDRPLGGGGHERLARGKVRAKLLEGVCREREEALVIDVGGRERRRGRILLPQLSDL